MTGLGAFDGWVEAEGLRVCEHDRGDQHARLDCVPDRRSRPALWRKLALDRPGPLGRAQAPGPSTDLRPPASPARRPLPVRRQVPSPGRGHGAVPPERAGPRRSPLQTRDQRPQSLLRFRRRSRDEPALRSPLGVPRRPPSRPAHPETDGERPTRNDRQSLGNQPTARVVPSPLPGEGRASTASRRSLSRRERASLMQVSALIQSPRIELDARGSARRAFEAIRDDVSQTAMKSFRIVFACGTPDAAESLRLGECSVETLQPRVRSHAFLDIVSLATCFLGFLGLIFVVWRMKTGVFGTPRALYLLFIGMACAPFYVAFLRPPKIPFLFPPVIALFLLYPIAAPHGIVYSTDPIFNFSFTQDLLRTGFWDPGGGNAFAKTYSFYPIGNVFVGYVVLNAPLPADIGYLWIEPVLRLLAIPASVYSFGRRLFGPRTAAIGLLLYLGTPSILFNDAVQQGFGTIFFALSLLALFMLVQAVDPPAQRRAMLLFAVVSAGIVMTHHLSSYVFAFWLTALAILMVRRRARH